MIKIENHPFINFITTFGPWIVFLLVLNNYVRFHLKQKTQGGNFFILRPGAKLKMYDDDWLLVGTGVGLDTPGLGVLLIAA